MKIIKMNIKRYKEIIRKADIEFYKQKIINFVEWI